MDGVELYFHLLLKNPHYYAFFESEWKYNSFLKNPHNYAFRDMEEYCFHVVLMD